MLRDRIKTETVAAMKARDKERVAALRLVSARIKDRDIEERTGKASADDDALVTDVLQKMAKQRRESIQMYEEGGRTELAEQEKAELAVIEEFLPQQMDEAQTRAAIERVKADTGADGVKDMGRVMGELKARHGAELDMTRASALVKESLS
ncbi:GatB/YqeY domain-containing protein [Aurantiacibacter spongiae]|uniref:GatB/YqeY domain-containing protein n=1 Tax=Aurantiacibacter spongiae TaxID=2488860 RepID=A0A3N5DF03_9SPHN|nr:GatB/YqeY domain-containing protein [Aurantiacibacter spongiae]RPF70222.1 GatB/YqeY domain-containing protein [Aurantiacibacter spongiae]